MTRTTLACRRFLPTVDLWSLSSDELANLLPGQWVSAGTPDDARNNCGRFYGVLAGGSIVVAWNGNARSRDSYTQYQRTMYTYAKGR